MVNLSVFSILKKIYGARGIPFPTKPTLANENVIIPTGFDVQIPPFINNGISSDNPIRKYTDLSLGKYEYMPVVIDGLSIPNAIIIISGEKEFIETNVVGAINSSGEVVGAVVFEKAFTKPYDITVIATLIHENGMEYPQSQMQDLVNFWKKDDVVTIGCALTDFFLERENNAILKKIAVLDNAGAENVEVLQFDFRSNIDFELEIM